MKRMSMAFVVAVLVSSFSGAAFAQKSPRSDSCAEQRKHDPKKVCTLDLEGSELKGDHVSPNGDYLLGHPPSKFGSLIRYRTSMLDKMAKDVDRF